MKRLLSILILLSFVAASAFADEVQFKEASDCARAFFAMAQKKPVNSVSVKNVAYSKIMKSGNDKPAFYVFNNASGKGFVIISADDNARAVLAYSKDQSFSPSTKMQSNILQWLVGLEKQISYVRSSKIKASKESAEEWKTLRNMSGWDVRPIVLLNTALWNQGIPYCWQCPVVGGYYCVTGCVQTATAILMKYYNHPSGPTQDIVGGYYLGADESGQWVSKTVPASRRYDWDNMLDDYNNGYSNVQGNAVAALMADLGVMQNAMYTTSSTGAYSFNLSDNLIQYMGYNKNARYRMRDNYSTKDWTDMLRADLDASHPVIYGGISNSGGHCFIVDGYAENDFFHINWGWGGMSNGFFAIDVFQSDVQGIGGNTDGSAFSFNQDAQFGLYPEKGEPYNPEYILQMDDMQLFQANDGRYYISAYNVFNMGDATIGPSVTFKIKQMGVNYAQTLYSTTTSVTIERTYGYTRLDLGYFSGVSRFRLGDYLTLTFKPSSSANDIAFRYNPEMVRGVIPILDAAFIECKDSYSAGEIFEKKIFYGDNMPESVTWFLDGNIINGDIRLTAGHHVIKALLKYPLSGCQETIVREVDVN